MVNFKVHCVRFIPYVPQAIHCLAVEGGKNARIAVSRADSSIEIWNIENNWYLERKIVGLKGTTIEALVWSGSRLFSSGLHGEITEWNLDQMVSKINIDSYGGAVWSLAVNQEQTLLAAGCEDGCVRLFDISMDDIQYARVFIKQEGRILSLDWHKDGQVLVTGGSDATIRVYEVSTGHACLRITLDNFSQRKTLVWSVSIMSDFTIVSGDSLGKTQFWNGKLGTLIKGFNLHIADVLTVCVNKEEDTVYSTGVDNKLMQFKLVVEKDGMKCWSRSISTRSHTHDVRTLALIENAQKSTLVSGGVDTNILVYNTKKYGNSEIRRIPSFPMRSEIHLASKAEVLMFQKSTSLHFWQLGKTLNEESCHLKHNPVHLLQLEAKRRIVCSTISNDGNWTAFSDCHKISVFKLTLDCNASYVEKLKFLPKELLPVHHMKFTKDSSKLITITITKTLQIIHLNRDSLSSETIQFPMKIDEAIDFPRTDVNSPVNDMAVSDDGTLCTTVDTLGHVEVFDVTEIKHKCTLPRFSKQITAMAFQPETNHLALVNSNKEVFMFDIEQMKMTSWSKKASKTGLPEQWQRLPSKVVNILFDCNNKEMMFLQSHDLFILLDISKPLPSRSIKLFARKTKKFTVGKKRKHSENHDENDVEYCEAFKICKKYKPLLFLGMNDNNSLVTVERSWLSIMECLPPTLYRKRYGT
ncbi:U3 small nucleolar RNA-associated protein 4 homolog [Xenia sp. Carnegie-2017]|uniref:U3 small nucleolar RNA-associated protein 4 homolog n=1 Tax=Xenia sp. Carnegie-2017 TaxID=2897299 RepID=UPI001F035E61|nr:U3 small nucleolar RNA-associated protein 4 homolog [Xenia sp. Carnegie-2017]